jgi:hypothetical protein
MWPWLASIGSWIVRLVGGWLPIGTKPVSEWFGKILWCVGIVTICLAAYHKFTAPISRTTQHADRDQVIVTNNNAPRATFGCATLKMMQHYRESPATNEVK